MVGPLDNKRGFSLLEVMMAMFIVAIFGVALLTGIGGNVFRSSEMREDLKVVELVEMKINELILDPPEFDETLLTAFTNEEKFKDFPDYTYSIKMHPFMLADYLASLGQGPESEEYAEEGELYKRVFNMVSRNVQKMIWQIEVTVTHTESERSYSVSTLLFNRDVNIDWEGGF